MITRTLEENSEDLFLNFRKAKGFFVLLKGSPNFENWMKKKLEAKPELKKKIYCLCCSRHSRDLKKTIKRMERENYLREKYSDSLIEIIYLDIEDLKQSDEESQLRYYESLVDIGVACSTYRVKTNLIIGATTKSPSVEAAIPFLTIYGWLPNLRFGSHEIFKKFESLLIKT